MKLTKNEKLSKNKKKVKRERARSGAIESSTRSKEKEQRE